MSKTVKIILGVVGGIIFLVIIAFSLVGSFNVNGENEKVTLEFWGVFDDVSLYQDALDSYKSTNKNVTINYTKFEYGEYENALINAFAEERGPDIYLIHNTWLPKYINKLSPMPEVDSQTGDPFILLSDFQSSFVDVVTYDFVVNGLIYAAPLYVDTLALYYNKDMFNDAGITIPPRTWKDFVTDVGLLTKRDEQGNIIRSGAAIGTALNINRSVDILYMLMLQGGTRMTNTENTAATFANSVQGLDVTDSALAFYTGFADRTKDEIYTWDRSSHYSIDAFAQGETAMMFNYSHQIPTIRSRAARFNYGVAPVPQQENGSFDIAYANYWAPVVSKQSNYVEESWRFLTYLMSSEGSISYINKSARPSARRDFIEKQKVDADLGVFARQALIARSWFQIDSVKIETIFADMIEDVNLNRKTVQDALSTAQNRVNVLMSR